MKLSDKQKNMLISVPVQLGKFTYKYRRFVDEKLQLGGWAKRAGAASTYRSLVGLGLVQGGPDSADPCCLTDAGRAALEAIRGKP